MTVSATDFSLLDTDPCILNMHLQRLLNVVPRNPTPLLIDANQEIFLCWHAFHRSSFRIDEGYITLLSTSVSGLVRVGLPDMQNIRMVTCWLHESADGSE